MPTLPRKWFCVVLAVVAINQVIGPILFRFALNRSNEIVAGTGAPTPAQPHPALE